MNLENLKTKAYALRYKVGTAVGTGLMVVGSAMPAVHAEGESSGNITAGMETSMTTAFNSVKTDVVSIIQTALPPALAIMGVVLAVGIGVRFFKRFAK